MSATQLKRGALWDRMQSLLDDCGLPYSVCQGKKHLKILLCGRMIAVLPRVRRSGDKVRDRNAEASVARAIRREGGTVT